MSQRSTEDPDTEYPVAVADEGKPTGEPNARQVPDPSQQVEQADWFTTNAPAAATGPAPGTPEYLQMVEDRFRAEGGNLYDPSDMAGFVRNAQQGQGSGTGPNGESWAGAQAALDNQLAIYGRRRASDGGPRGATGGGGSTASGGGSNAMSSFASPRPYKPFEEVFAWDPTKIRQSEAYNFRQKEEADAITRSALSRGAFLTGTTAHALNDRAATVAATFEDADYGRAKGDYLTRASIHDTNENGIYNTGRNNMLDQFGISDTNRKFEQSVSNDAFAHLFRFADYGQTANGQLAVAAGNNANLGTDLITGAGNAQAAGTVSAASLWNTGLTNIGNAALSRSSRDRDRDLDRY